MKLSTYKTKDLYEGAYLCAQSQKLLELEMEGKFFWFIYEDQEKCQKLADEYWQGTAIVNAKGYASAIRDLKDRVFAQK